MNICSLFPQSQFFCILVLAPPVSVRVRVRVSFTVLCFEFDEKLMRQIMEVYIFKVSLLVFGPKLRPRVAYHCINELRHLEAAES